MMKRRAFFAALLPADAQAIGSLRTHPKCPVCQTPLPQGTPELLPVTAEVNGDISTMPHVRDMFCSNCGVRFVCVP